MEKINEIYLQLPLFIQNAARIENCVRTLAQTVAAQIVWSPVARVTSLKTIAASGSSSPDSARSWNMLGQSNGSPASVTRGSHGQGHPMTIGIRDVDLILFKPWRRTCTECLLLTVHMWTIPHWDCSVWEKQTFQSTKKPVRIHCKGGSVSARLVFETRAKCQDFVARYKDDGISYEIDTPFCSTKTTISVRQSKSLEDREIGKQFSPLWRVLAGQLKILFPDGDDEGAFVVPALDARAQVLSIKSRGKLVFKLAPFGSGQLFTLVAPDLCVFLVFLVKSCNGSSLKPARPMCDDRRPFASPLFRRLVGRGTLFRGFPFRWVLHLALSLTRSITVHDATLYSRDDTLYECGRPCDNLSFLFFTAYGFGKTNPYWYSRFSEPRISIWLATKRCIRWTFVYFWKSTICTNKLDDTQLNRSRAYISWCRFSHGGIWL